MPSPPPLFPRSRDIATDTNTAPRDDDVQSSYGAPVELKLLRDDDRSIWFVSSNLEVRSAAPLTYGRVSYDVCGVEASGIHALLP